MLMTVPGKQQGLNYLFAGVHGIVVTVKCIVTTIMSTDVPPFRTPSLPHTEAPEFSWFKVNTLGISVIFFTAHLGQRKSLILMLYPINLINVYVLLTW